MGGENFFTSKLMGQVTQVCSLKHNTYDKSIIFISLCEAVLEKKWRGENFFQQKKKAFFPKKLGRWKAFLKDTFFQNPAEIPGKFWSIPYKCFPKPSLKVPLLSFAPQNSEFDHWCHPLLVNPISIGGGVQSTRGLKEGKIRTVWGAGCPPNFLTLIIFHFAMFSRKKNWADFIFG